MFFKKIYLASFAVVLFSATFVESSSAAAAQTSTSNGGNLRKTVNDEETKADIIENIQPEDEVFWRRALSVSNDQAFFAFFASDSVGADCSGWYVSFAKM